MRSLTCSVLASVAIVSVSTAMAADLDYGVLRGPDYEPAVAVIDWSGFYIGGHGGYSSAAIGSRGAFQPLVANILRATTIEAEMSASTLLSTRDFRVDGASYGAFLGYNVQFDEVVLGLEADYSRFDINGFSEDSIGRSKTLSDGYLSSVYLHGRSATRVIDYGTIRARAGYAFGSFLPYVTAGLAIGRAKINDSVTVATHGYNPSDAALPPFSSFEQAHISKVKTVAGAALGAGIEYAITPNILLRGEYQYVLFSDFDGHKVNMNTVRGGAALKF